MMIISVANSISDRCTPPGMVSLAKQAVREDQFNSVQGVWVERILSEGTTSSGVGFNFIQFDGQVGKATSSYLSPIYKALYYS